MGYKLTQFKAVMRKNAILQRRNSKDLFREIVWPVFFVVILLVMKHSIKNKVVDDPILHHDPTLVATTMARAGSPASVVLFAPCDANVTSPVQRVANGVASLFACDVKCLADPASVDAEYLANPDATFGAVVFRDPATVLDNTASVPYNIRLNVDDDLPNVGDVNITSSWRIVPDSSGDAYLSSFLPLQNAVQATVLSLRSGGAALTSDVAVQEFPTMPYVDDIGTQALSGILPIYLLIIFSIQIRVLLTRILEEKEKKLKEGQKMMGLSDSVFWLAWLAMALIKNGIVTILVVICVQVGGLFGKSDFTVVLAFFLLFMMTCISFAFLLTTFFSSARTGGTIGMLGFIVLSTPGYAISGSSMSSGALAALGLLSPLSFNYGSTILNDAENLGGLHWSNINEHLSDDYDIGMGTVMVILMACTAWHSLLTWWLDKVVPNEYGTTLKPYFCFTRSYWCPRRSASTEHARLLDAVDVEAAAVATEPVAPEIASRGCVELAGLTKVFSSSDGNKLAVDHLGLKMYEGTVTALLGHNGAGKTTTVAMLTGLIPPTSGDAHVFGDSIVNNMAAVRQNIGVCPQHDVLFDKLSVKEHIELFAGLKGIPRGARMDAIVKELIADVGLQEKRDAHSSTLSGGQKRRLSVAIALVGDPKVVFLDECTSGMDPGSRRQIWNLIERKKEGRVIVLTTHFMDEADLLGDRVAIMAKGRLRVVGSSLFLKSRFGIGYHLVMTANAFTDTEAAVKLVKTHIPAVRTDTDSPGSDSAENIAMLLPLDAVGSFAGLFAELEDQQEALGIVDYGIAVTSLEEVFLRLAERVAEEEAAAADDAANSAAGVSREASVHVDISDLGRDLGVGAVQKAAEEAEGAAESKAAAFEPMDMDMEAKQGPTSQTSSVAAGIKDRFTSLLTTVSMAGSSRASVWSQTKTQFWRRLRQARRDKRGLWLQCFVPLMFVAISITFRSLSKIDTLSSLDSFGITPATFAAEPHSLNLPYAVNAALSTADATPFEPFVTSVMAKYPQDYMTTQRILNDTTWDDIESYLYYQNKYAAGALVFQQSKDGLEYRTTVMHNTSFPNAVPTLLMEYHTAALRTLTGADAGASFDLTFEPLPRLPSQTSHSTGEYLSSALMGFYIALGFCTIPALMATNVVKERENKAKQLQLIMGMSVPSYWMSVWMWDFIQYTVPWFGSAILVYALGPDSYHGINFLALFLLLACYGLAVPGLTYTLSFMFKTSTMAQTAIMAAYTLGTMLLFFGSFILDFPSLDIAPIAGKLVKYIGMLFPNYALAQGFADVGLLGACPQNVDCEVPSPFSWDLAGAKLIYMVLSVPVFFCIILYIERSLSPSAGSDGYTTYQDPVEPVVVEDEDVLAEATRIQSADSTDQVLAKNLRKVYKSDPKPKVAVHSVSFGAKRGECLGILGPNGAGKTSTLGILTADVAPTSGQAVVCGADISQDRAVVYSNLGYCPQFDALFDLLTGEETLEFYARIKGIPDNVLDDLVDASITKMGLTKYRSQLTKEYSGGNKRKLSMAVAYIGAPRVVVMDEPSTGMDPAARRSMWEVVKAMRPGRTVLLTTHLMEEADALCSRIGIMVNGRLACLGTSQHLKSKYGAGYQIEARTADVDKVPALQALVEELSPGAVLDEAHGGYVKYTVAQNLSLSRVFGRMEERRAELALEDYAVSQTTLEQVFLRFSRMQTEAEAK